MPFQPDIKPDLLEWARERAGLSPEAIEESFPKYQAWVSGASKPTMAQLEALAKKTGAPLGYLFLQSRPEEPLPIPDYRTMDEGAVGRPSADLLDTVYAMQRRQDWLRDYLEEQGDVVFQVAGVRQGYRLTKPGVDRRALAKKLSGRRTSIGKGTWK